MTLGQPYHLKCPPRNTPAFGGVYPEFGVETFWTRRAGARFGPLPASVNRLIMPEGDLVFLYVDQSDLNQIKDKTIQCSAIAGETMYSSHQIELNASKIGKIIVTLMSNCRSPLDVDLIN